MSVTVIGDFFKIYSQIVLVKECSYRIKSMTQSILDLGCLKIAGEVWEAEGEEFSFRKL